MTENESMSLEDALRMIAEEVGQPEMEPEIVTPEDDAAQVAAIVKVLKASEDSLSDGYGFYCGSANVDTTLAAIAGEILAALACV